jgi:cell division protein FtsZ
VWLQGVQGVSDLVAMPGLVNVDFADIRAVMAGSGTAMLGVASASGEGRAVEAALVRCHDLCRVGSAQNACVW